MVPRIGIARVVNAILVVVKSLIRQPLVSSIYKGATHCLKQLKNMAFQFLPLQRYLKNVPQNQAVSCRIHPIAITLQMDATYWGRNF